MLSLLWALIFQQPSLTVQVDRDTVMVGDDVVVTIMVSSSGSEPVIISDPELQGLVLIDRREQTQVSIADGLPLRVTTRVLILRAVRAGSALVGAVSIRQGNARAEAGSRVITVRRPLGTAVQVLTDREREVLTRIQPPVRPPDEVALTVVTSSDAILLGEQVDLLVVAWFPRAVREQLRHPPTLEAPSVRGAWVYPRPAPTDVALSRRIGSRWYDLYVLHQIVFPLTAGEVEIGPASVSYSVPLSTSFLSRELRREDRSEPRTLSVSALPPISGGATFSGAAGEDITIDLDVSTTELRPGDAAIVRVELRGRGNVSLWPEPALQWPVGLRAYRQDVIVDIAIDEGRVGGSKTYEYLVVGDSVGQHRLPSLTYRYFDLAARGYRDAATPSVTFASTGMTGSLAPLRSIAPLMERSGVQRIHHALATLPMWIWAVVLILPPLGVLIVRFRGRLWVSLWRARGRDQPAGALMRSDAELSQALSDLVPLATTMSGADLAAALRAAGMESSLAAHATRIRDRLHHARYGPDGGTDSTELIAEVDAVLSRLRQEGAAVASRVLVVALGLAMAVGSWQPLPAQSAESLYAAGAVRIAADSFAARAESQPYVAAHWFNLGNAYQRLDASTHARAAWFRAARLAPRNGRVRSALRQTMSPDPVSERLTWLSPVSLGEATMGALVMWILGWVLLLMRARLRWCVAVLALAAVLGAYAGVVRIRYGEPVSLVVRGDTPLRVAPYGTATAIEQLQEAMAVRVEQRWGSWRLVSRGPRRGWLHESEMVGI